MNESTKQHFNTVAKESSGMTYEERRWNSNPRTQFQHDTATEFISTRVLPLVQDGKTIFELGPGPGTWTRLFTERFPNMRFILADISAEMLARARTVVSSQNVETREGDFADTAIQAGEADFFFSSRAFEYVEHKPEAMKKIYTLLKNGGRGCIITKTPKPIANMLTGRKPSALHRGQISPRACLKVMRDAGLTRISVYPVTFSFPLLRSAAADRLIERFFEGRTLNPFSSMFSESYGVLFEKPQ